MLKSTVQAPAVPGLDLHIAPQDTPEEQLLAKSGARVAQELAGRFLLRYVLRKQVGAFTAGTRDKTHATPTPLAPEETVRWLALPAVPRPRRYVLLIDPARLPDGYKILGPRWVRLGGGIEYILPDGYPREAIVTIGTEPDGQWELVVR
jgi:hypothetical protein